MAKHWVLRTDAPRDELLAAVSDVLFSPPTAKDRLNLLSKGAQLRSQIRWERTNVPEADIAAQVVSGGAREAVSSSKRGPGSMLGSTMAIKVEESEGQTLAEFWMAGQNTFFGFGMQNDLTKAYSKMVSTALTERGRTVSATKV